MGAYDLSPLLTIPAGLLQAMRSQPYLAMATELLRDAMTFDFHLATASIARPREDSHGLKDFYLDCSAIQKEDAYKIFSGIRQKKETIDAEFPELGHVAGLLDYTAHTVINVLPSLRGSPRPYASLDPRGHLQFLWNGPHSFEQSLAAYLGISPFPFFLNDLDHAAPENAARLIPFGFGVYATLTTSVIPELAARGWVPPDIHSQWEARPLIRHGIRSAPDGSMRLE